MSTPTPTMNNCLVALCAGQDARNNLRLGDVFLGAVPAAINAGYPRGTPEHRLFIEGYMENLPEIWTGEGNRITMLKAR